MGDTIGEYGVGELRELIGDLEDTAASTRRENLPELLDEVTRLATLIGRERDADRDQLAEAERRYAERFGGVLGRFNPFNRDERQRYWKERVKPYAREVAGDDTLYRRIFLLLQEVHGAAGAIEWREADRGGLAAVYDPLMGRVHWREAEGAAVAGVYDPETREMEWQAAAAGVGVHGVWNERTRRVVWRINPKGGVYGVFDPLAGDLVWREAEGAGVAGVFVAARREVVWREAAQGHTIAVAVDPTTGELQWRERAGGGIACVYHDGRSYRTSFGTLAP